MEEMMVVDVFQTRDDLKQDALYTSTIQTLMIPCLHQLVKIAVHVLHGDMQLLRDRIQEDVKSRDEMRVKRQRTQEDDLPQLQALVVRVEGLLHRLDGNLETALVWTQSYTT